MDFYSGVFPERSPDFLSQQRENPPCPATSIARRIATGRLRAVRPACMETIKLGWPAQLRKGQTDASRSRTNREYQDSSLADRPKLTHGKRSEQTLRREISIVPFFLLPRKGILDENRLSKNENSANSEVFEASGGPNGPGRRLEASEIVDGESGRTLDVPAKSVELIPVRS